MDDTFEPDTVVSTEMSLNMQTDDESPSNTRHRRERSTRYPGVPLADGIRLCEHIQTNGLDGLAATEIATSLGYKNIKTNTFSARLSSARQFGLLDLKEDGYSLTSLAREILHPINPTDTPKLYKRAFLNSALYAELTEKLQGKRLPDRSILANILYHNHQIIAAAKEVAADTFVESARFAGLLNDEGVLLAQAESVPAERPSVSPKRNLVEPSPDQVRLELRLWGADQGKTIRLRAPESISRASFERLIQALQLHVRIED